MKRAAIKALSALMCILLFCGCVSPRTPALRCTVLIEDNAQLALTKQIFEVRQNESLSFTVGVPTGQRISDVSYENHSVSAKTSSSPSYDYYTVTLHQIRYGCVVRISTAPAYTTAYHANESTTVLDESPHLFSNTLAYRPEFFREGFVPIGWNTESDGSGTCIGFGSRIDRRNISELTLYAQYLPANAQEDFLYTVTDHGVCITGFTGSGNLLVIPQQLDGQDVICVCAGAFRDLQLETLVLPPTLLTLEEGAFSDITADNLYFFDNIETVSDASFQGCVFSSIHIQAAVAPVYSGSYFDTFADKMDYLESLRDQQKIVLFCGSSARFGYDSEALDAAFPNYRTVNMGVYAYSNMRPQAELICKLLKPGDVVLSSPELDAIEQQFCASTALDKEIFCMTESNYDLFSRLDASGYTGIFDAFQSYNLSRSKMQPRSYTVSAADYDEDGNPQLTPVYNLQGDYILYRPNNDKRINFGIKRAFYNKSYISDADIDGLNRVYDAFAAQGATVLFTYSPRSRTSISADSTEEAIAQLDVFLRQNLHAQFLSPIDESLMDPYYFYGTDNHLSTDGVALFTDRIIRYLKGVLP